MPLIKATDRILALADGSVAFSKLPQTPSDVFSITFGHSATTSIPASTATTYRFGALYGSGAVTTSNQSRRVIAPVAGTLSNVSIVASYTNPASSTDPATMVIRNITTTTNYTISSSLVYGTTGDSYNLTYNVVSSPLIVNAGDSLEMQWTTAAWSTPPTSVSHSVTAWFKRVLA